MARRLASHLKELLLYQRAIQVTSGNALLEIRSPDAAATPGTVASREDARVAAEIRAEVARNRETKTGTAAVFCTTFKASENPLLVFRIDPFSMVVVLNVSWHSLGHAKYFAYSYPIRPKHSRSMLHTP